MSKTPKKIILDELKSKGLGHIAPKIKSIRRDHNSIRVVTMDLFKSDREILKKMLDEYTYGTFDGMQDLYVYDRNKPEKEFSCKFAFLNNTFSEDVTTKIKQELSAQGVTDDESSQRSYGRWYDQVLWTKCCDLDENPKGETK